MPSWDQTGVPGFVAFTHFHSSTISGSAFWMRRRTFSSVFPRQSPSARILLSIWSEAAEPSALFADAAGSEVFVVFLAVFFLAMGSSSLPGLALRGSRPELYLGSAGRLRRNLLG